ncbi:hypothetical protein OAV88_00250 [bacterium]|nr:hypothetical protein [bacterium]
MRFPVSDARTNFQKVMSNKAAQRRERRRQHQREMKRNTVTSSSSNKRRTFQTSKAFVKMIGQDFFVFLLLGVLAAANIFCIVEADFFPRDDRIACSYNKKKRNNNNNNNNTYMIHTTTYLPLSTYTYLPTYYAHTNHRLFLLGQQLQFVAYMCVVRSLDRSTSSSC